MTRKLTEVASQRFIDNITSITPGALKGGIMAIDSTSDDRTFRRRWLGRHAKVYRTFREVSARSATMPN